VEVLVERGRTDFSSRLIRTSMCTVWERTGIQNSRYRHPRAMMMSHAPAMVGTTDWEKTSSPV
jgi:hypothetical protein